MEKHNGKNKLHRVLMILCCTIPIIVLGGLYIGRVQGTPLGSVLSIIAILLCPLMHLLIIPLVMKSKKNESTEGNKTNCH